VTEDRDWAALFDQTYAVPLGSVEERISREVFGDEYPEGLGTHSFLSRSELDWFVREVSVGPGEVLGDFGCGRGGPGLWIIAQTGSRLVGLDISATALELAKARAESLGLFDRCSWQLGTFDATGLEDRSLDAIMSVDALLFTPDKVAAIREFARVLRPGGRLVMTTWDYHSPPKGRPPQVPDHRPLLQEAGFDVLTYEESVDWRHRQRATIDRMIAAVDELAAETGEDRDELEADLHEMRATEEAMIARRLIVAERSGARAR
jgi:SAM-dependent methyltransferase